jgi:two-component system sensor histidine kinase KdpD
VPTDDLRPDPDALLAQARASENRGKRGRLRIFFGMCPGVGKTYAMLQAALRRHAAGVEVVVGVVETHGRAETEAMIRDLPVVPMLEIPHRGTTLRELDLDAILAWRPALVLVDELAHSNAPGSRHPKRYQDVLELLEAGIDIFTTVNVQHIESRAEAVRQIAGVAVRETVPDSLLDLAEEIELVDLTPEQLRQRLAEGRVYLGDRAAAAADNFFREANLTALREMALRVTAEHVERRLRVLRPVQESWRAGDRLLVAVSTSPHSAQLLRWTRRYAAGLNAPWCAVVVETPAPLADDAAVRLSTHIALARQLGAEVILTSGASVGEAILRVARQQGATQIILGKPEGGLWRWLFHGRSPVPWLIRHSGSIDLQLVRTEVDQGVRDVPSRTRPVPLNSYLRAVAVAVCVTLGGLAVKPWIGYSSVALLYLLAVIVTALALPRIPTLLLAALSALLWNFLFIPPVFTFHISQAHDFMMFAMFFVVALVMGNLTARLRERELLERRREERATALYRFMRELARCDTSDAAVRTTVDHLHEAFDLNAAIIIRDEHGTYSGAPHPGSTWKLGAKEEGVAAWAFQNKRAAGRGTDALPDSAGLHLPLAIGDRVEGILSVELPDRRALSPEQRELLDAFGSQLALVAEKARLAIAQQREQVLAQSQKLQKTLFDSVSHELKTPIAAIQAALDQPTAETGEIQRAVHRLRHTVDHLLDATRLETGALRLNVEWCIPEEIAREAMERLGAAGDAIVLDLAPNLPAIRADGSLLAQALATVLHNALTHGQSMVAPVLVARAEPDSLRFDVVDRGGGLPVGEEESIFGAFRRGASVPAGGLGLGLSIARRIAELHHGALVAENRPGGGSRFTMRVPIGGEMKLPA